MASCSSTVLILAVPALVFVACLLIGVAAYVFVSPVGEPINNKNKNRQNYYLTISSSLCMSSNEGRGTVGVVSSPVELETMRSLVKCVYYVLLLAASFLLGEVSLLLSSSSSLRLSLILLLCVSFRLEQQLLLPNINH